MSNLEHSLDSLEYARVVRDFEAYKTDIRSLYYDIDICWDYDTSYCEDYQIGTPGQTPSYGQCAVTTLLLQELLGGECYRGIVKYDDVETSHYWLVLDDGRKVDFTWDQFPPYATLEQVEQVPRTRLLPDYNKWMQLRYSIFKERFNSPRYYIKGTKI